MKTLHLILNLGVFFAVAMASAQGIESSMNGFKLETCSDAQQCVTVTALKTQGSQMKMLHTFKTPEVTITSPHSKTTLRGDSGYVDLEENQVVIFKKTPGKITETSINLTSLEMNSSETRVGQ